MSFSDLYLIKPLRGAEDYICWRVQISDVLKVLDLWEYTSGAIACPSDAASAVDWYRKDRKALMIIRLRVSNTMFPYVAGATTSKEAFDSLAEAFPSLVSKLYSLSNARRR